MRQELKKINEIITRQLSEKYNLPEYHIKIIHDSPFRLMSEELEKGGLKSFYMFYFGRFGLTKGKKKWLEENLERIKEEKRRKLEQTSRDSGGVSQPVVP